MGMTGACCCHIRRGCQVSDGAHGCLILTISGSPSRHTQEVFVSLRLKAWFKIFKKKKVALLERQKGPHTRKVAT